MYSFSLTSLPREVQQEIFDDVDLRGLGASACVSRAWHRAVRENSLLFTLARLRLWPSASLRKVGVHLTWQSVLPPLQQQVHRALVVVWLRHCWFSMV